AAASASPRPAWRTASARATSDGDGTEAWPDGRDAAVESTRLMELLRFATAGSVDDGKSTLIGRLLLETKQIFEDQLDAIERTSRDKGFDYTNLALLTDGLRAEREQGI